jgi:hypothetical protein
MIYTRYGCNIREAVDALCEEIDDGKVDVVMMNMQTI